MIFFRVFLLASLIAIATSGFAAAQGLSVKVALEGLPEDLERELRPVSSLARKPGNFNALAPIRRAANADAQALLSALQSKGYYAATVTPSLVRTGDEVSITFEAERGERFSITSYRLEYEDDQEGARPATPEGAGLETSAEATGASLEALRGELLNWFWNQGYLGAEMVRHTVLADFSSGTATASFTLRTGPKGSYGDIRVEGAERTDPDYIRMHRTFETGELAQRSDLDSYRSRLAGTNLFTEAEVLPQLPQPDGTTDILVRVEERKHRTLGGGVAFATDVGPSANLFWENRNLMHRGETLRTEMKFSAPIQEASASFRKDRPRLPGYTTLSTVLRNEDTDAFTAQTIELGGSIAKRWLDRRLTTEGGVRYQYSSITEEQCIGPRGRQLDVEDDDCLSLGGTTQEVDETFQAVSTPIGAAWNSQQDPLDPQEGFKSNFLVTPFFGTENFTRIEVSYTDRVFWGRNDGGTLAGRFKLGAIYGASRADIPATERFFAGGGGSIRGYAFQEASPIERSTGDILGGASVAEFNIEIRQHVTEAIELALFTDLGGAFEENTPDFENVLVGAGIGVRYHTPIGPFRVDFAFPLDRREIFSPLRTDGEPVFQDTAFQVYLGLGQPF